MDLERKKYTIEKTRGLIVRSFCVCILDDILYSLLCTYIWSDRDLWLCHLLGKRITSLCNFQANDFFVQTEIYKCHFSNKWNSKDMRHFHQELMEFVFRLSSNDIITMHFTWSVLRVRCIRNSSNYDIGMPMWYFFVIDLTIRNTDK